MAKTYTEQELIEKGRKAAEAEAKAYEAGRRTWAIQALQIEFAKSSGFELGKKLTEEMVQARLAKMTSKKK